MSCLNCGAPKIIDAHLIPKAFVAAARSERDEQHSPLGLPARKVFGEMRARGNRRT